MEDAPQFGGRDTQPAPFSRAPSLSRRPHAGYLLGALLSHRWLELTGYRRGFYLPAIIQALLLFLMGANVPFTVMMAALFVQDLLAARWLAEPERAVKGQRASLSPVFFAIAAYGLYGGRYIGYMTFAPSEVVGTRALF